MYITVGPLPCSLACSFCSSWSSQGLHWKGFYTKGLIVRSTQAVSNTKLTVILQDDLVMIILQILHSTALTL